MRSRLLLSAPLIAAMLFAAPAAYATDYCVGWSTPCPGTDEGSGAAGLQSALDDAAATTSTHDRVLIDAAGGPYTKLHGFSYAELTSLNAVDVIGVSATQPLITATFDGSQQAVLKVASPGGSTVQNVHVDLPNDAFDGYGLQIDGGTSADHVTVTGPVPGTGLDDGVISNRGDVTHSTIALSTTTAVGIDARPSTRDLNVTDNTITAARGIDIFGDPAHDAVISRNVISVGYAGIYASAGGAWRADNDLIDLRGTGQYGIYAGTSPTFTVNNGFGRNLTIRNGATTSSPQGGVVLGTTGAISVALADSIIRDVTHPVVQMTPVSMATNSFTGDRDDYDASQNVPLMGSLVAGQTRAETNLSLFDPLFLNPISGANGVTGDYRLASNSPAIDAGDVAPLGAGETDLAGLPRMVDGAAPCGGGVRDLGAYEFQGGPCVPAPPSRGAPQQPGASKKCKKRKHKRSVTAAKKKCKKKKR